jgi:hypothetical protein
MNDRRSMERKMSRGVKMAAVAQFRQQGLQAECYTEHDIQKVILPPVTCCEADLAMSPAAALAFPTAAWPDLQHRRPWSLRCQLLHLLADPLNAVWH